LSRQAGQIGQHALDVCARLDDLRAGDRRSVLSLDDSEALLQLMAARAQLDERAATSSREAQERSRRYSA
jgi:hypothetical protein